jgi:hypothetical protein
MHGILPFPMQHPLGSSSTAAWVVARRSHGWLLGAAMGGC